MLRFFLCIINVERGEGTEDGRPKKEDRRRKPGEGRGKRGRGGDRRQGEGRGEKW